MPTITTNDLKNGMTLNLDDGLFNVVEFQHVKPPRARAGHSCAPPSRTPAPRAVLDRTFRAGEKVERANIDRREMQYLYNDGESFVFMDSETYEQLYVGAEVLGDAVNYLVENNSVILGMFGTEIVGTDLPAAVELDIAQTEPGVQGDRVSGATKPATCQTGWWCRCRCS